MDPQRFFRVIETDDDPLLTSDDLTISCEAGRFGNNWVVWTNKFGEVRYITQGDLFSLCEWMRRLRWLEAHPDKINSPTYKD